MLGPAVKRELVVELRREHGLTERRAFLEGANI
jgi:hypothetical protein